MFICKQHFLSWRKSNLAQGNISNYFKPIGSWIVQEAMLSLKLRKGFWSSHTSYTSDSRKKLKIYRTNLQFMMVIMNLLKTSLHAKRDKASSLFYIHLSRPRIDLLHRKPFSLKVLVLISSNSFTKIGTLLFQYPFISAFFQSIFIAKMMLQDPESITA